MLAALFRPGEAFASGAPMEQAQLQLLVPEGQVWKTYYYAGSQRVAMRVQDGVTDEVYYLYGDHLGSTSITTDSLGNVEAELRYTAWGYILSTGKIVTGARIEQA